MGVLKLKNNLDQVRQYRIEQNDKSIVIVIIIKRHYWSPFFAYLLLTGLIEEINSTLRSLLTSSTTGDFPCDAICKQ